jgi:hypothetical protein
VVHNKADSIRLFPRAGDGWATPISQLVPDKAAEDNFTASGAGQDFGQRDRRAGRERGGVRRG